MIRWRELVLIVFLSLSIFSVQIFSYSSSIDCLTYEGISLSGSDSLIIEGKNLVIEGKIVLSRGSSLIIRNSSVCLRSNPHNRGIHKSEIVLLDESKFLLENTSIDICVNLDPSYHIDGRILLRNKSRLSICDSNISCDNSLLIKMSNESTAFINNSKYTGKAPASNCLFCLERMLPRGVLRKLFDDYWIFAFEKSSLNIKGSSIGYIWAHDHAKCNISESNIVKLHPYSSEKVYVSDSMLKALSLSKIEGEITFTGNHQGFHTLWDTEDVFGKEVFNGDVKIKDSAIKVLWLSLSHCDAVISDAEVGIVSLFGGEAKIFNSDIWILENRNENPLLLEGSNVDYLTAWCEAPTVELFKSHVNWLGLGGSDNITVKTLKSKLDTCKLYNFEKPSKLLVNCTDSVIKIIKIKTGSETILDFDNTAIIESVSLNKSDPNDKLEVKNKPLILSGVKLIGEASTFLDKPEKNGVKTIEENKYLPLLSIAALLIFSGYLIKKLI